MRQEEPGPESGPARRSATARVMPALAALALLASIPASAAGQVATVPVPVAGPLGTNLGVSVLDELDERFAMGDAAGASRVARKIVEAAVAAGLAEAASGVLSGHVALVWVAADRTGRTVLRRIHLPFQPRRPHSLDLPGVGSEVSGRPFHELFVAADPRAVLASTYTSSREADALASGVEEFVDESIGPFFGLLAGVAGELRSIAPAAAAPGEREERRREMRLQVTAARVVLPFTRATVKVSSIALVPLASNRVAASASDLAATLAFRQAAESPCARDYASRLARVVARVSAQEPCAVAPPGSAACLNAFHNAFSEAWSASVSMCRPRETDVETSDPVSAIDLQGMRAVDGKFRDFVVAGRPERVESQVTFSNRPPAHFGFGVGTALVLAGKVDRPRVKLERGVLVADALGRQLTMALVTWSPRGYDEQAYGMSASERFRPFAGVILTPDFGLGGGLSIALGHRVGVNLGAGVLFTRAARAGDVPGAPPANAARPFSLGFARVIFAGVHLG